MKHKETITAIIPGYVQLKLAGPAELEEVGLGEYKWDYPIYIGRTADGWPIVVPYPPAYIEGVPEVEYAPTSTYWDFKKMLQKKHGDRYILQFI